MVQRRQSSGRGGSGGVPSSPEPTPPGRNPRRQLMAALEGIATVHDALSERFHPDIMLDGVRGEFARTLHGGALESATAQAVGGAAVLMAVLPSFGYPGLEKQVDNLTSLWNMLAMSVEIAHELKPTGQQAESLRRAYKLLSDCARTRQPEKGLEAVRIITLSIEPDSKARSAVLALHTPGVNIKQDEAFRRSLTGLHRLTQCTLVVYCRLGALHRYIAGLPKESHL